MTQTQQKTTQNSTPKSTVKVVKYIHLSTLTRSSTLVNVILDVCTGNSTKNKTEVLKTVLELCKQHDIKTTKAKTAVTAKNCATLLNAMCRDINNERKGWWSNYKVTTVKDVFRFELKPVKA